MLPLTVFQQPVLERIKPSGGVVSRHGVALPWAWDRLVFAAPLWGSDRNGMQDVVNHVLPDTLTDVAFTRDVNGNPAMDATGLTTAVAYPDNPVHDSPSSAVTAMVRCQPSASQDAYGGLFCNKYSVGASPWTTWIIQQNATNTRQVQAVATIDGTPVGSGATATLPTGQDLCFFLRWAVGGSVILDVLDPQGNNVDTQKASANVTSGTLTYNTGQGLQLGSTEGGDAQFGGVYSLAMVWARRLTLTEIRELARTPYGWMTPRRESISTASPLVLLTGHHLIGQAGSVRVDATADAQDRISTVTATNPTGVDAMLRVVVNGAAEYHVVPASGSYTRIVDLTTETVSRFGIIAG